MIQIDKIFFIKATLIDNFSTILGLNVVKMDLLQENECKSCHKKTTGGIRRHISQSEVCQKDYSEADMQILKKWAKDKKNAKREEKRKNARNAILKSDKVKIDLLKEKVHKSHKSKELGLLKENECKFCHKKTTGGIRRHISQSKICQNDYSEADMQILKKWAKERKNAKKEEKRSNDRKTWLKRLDEKKRYNSKKRAEHHEKVYDPEKNRNSYDPEWRAVLHRKNYDSNKRSELHDRTYDPQKRSKLYGKLYEKKEADKERKIKELNEKYQKAHFDHIDEHYEDKARKANIFDFKITKDYFEKASHDINKMANLSEEIRGKIKKIYTKIETNYKLYETKIDNAVAKNALGNKLIQDIYSEELFGEKCHYGLFEGWHDFKLQMDLEFIDIAKTLKKVYPGTFVCTCFKCQDAKGYETIMKSSENQGLSTHTMGKKHMKYSYISSKERHKRKAKARGEKIM